MIVNNNAPFNPPHPNPPHAAARFNWERIRKIALLVLFSASSVGAMLYQPLIFFGGFLVGVIAKKEHSHAVFDRIEALWKRQPWASAGVIALATIFAFPFVITAGSFSLGTRTGLAFSEWKLPIL